MQRYKIFTHPGSQPTMFNTSPHANHAAKKLLATNAAAPTVIKLSKMASCGKVHASEPIEASAAWTHESKRKRASETVTCGSQTHLDTDLILIGKPKLLADTHNW